MSKSPSRLSFLARVAVVAPLSLAFLPGAAVAQAHTNVRWMAVPMLGFGVVRQGGWGSGGIEAALELGYERAGWRWNGFGSMRGLGVACSQACFDGGPALAVGAMRHVGPLWIGGGMGAMRDFAAWHALPYGVMSLDAAPVRFDLRVEFPQQSGPGVYMPVLVGVPIGG